MGHFGDSHSSIAETGNPVTLEQTDNVFFVVSAALSLEHLAV